MTNNREQDRDNERIRTLLASTDRDAAPPDSPFLEKLGEQSLQLFASQPVPAVHTSKERNKMMVLAFRGIAAAAAIVVFTWLVAPPTDDSALTLAAVLQKTAEAESLHLRIVNHNGTSDVWASTPARLRWDIAKGIYRIDNGEHLWLVNEAANQATSGPSVYFQGSRSGVDLLRLVNLPKTVDRTRLLQAKPVDQRTVDGTVCDVYRGAIPLSEGTLQVEAIVDADKKMLCSLTTRDNREKNHDAISTLTVLAVNEPIDDDRFLVSDSLTQDGRIGKVIDCQGLVTVKPVMHRRWTPVRRNLVLKPGDWIRTDLRGANAVSLKLATRAIVTLGPGSLAELVTPSLIRIHTGELHLAADPTTPITLVGPDRQEIVAKGTHTYSVMANKLARLAKQPGWLRGFQGATNDESIGSLVAKIDGRDVPLTVGYHKVTVDIRDQIARTVIEESFVNHTKNRLEGVFYFPLPQDASISGFGMWIGDELVEADVVEKQRAREIYETILREKRDPGLLEWTGGNLFKARVFPIEGRSDKRIKITYTQVLPSKGSHFRYDYSLRSELLKKHPLKELAIDVRIHSASPIANVTSPTHMARIDKTTHSAHVEFIAQEYTPTRDFEVLVQLDADQPAVTMIPHRRGDDGYFLLQVKPPATAGNEERKLSPEGNSLELLILADTSASMDSDTRQVQANFIAALLSSLALSDSFNLATTDVDCQWVFDQPVPADAGNIEAARKQLEQRASLGWSDLDRAFEAVFKRTNQKTNIVYVGDGIATTGDANPVALSRRLRQMGTDQAGSFHAVAIGSSFEPVVLKAIASLGGGSVRHVTGQQNAQQAASELLDEIAQPTVRDVKIEFPGLTTARVYPEKLPNLPANTQQIVLGRYLPQGNDQQGEVIVTGQLGNQPVRMTCAVTLKDAEQGNSFIPRLWARMHLDALLEQGTSQSIQNEIIQLSEQYHIITPYTSLLVLESDEDRARFKVTRRYQMRDGQEFFAKGQDNVNYELLQQQIQRARDWRTRLRMAVLRQLPTLGRDPQEFQTTQRYRGRSSGSSSRFMRAGGIGGSGPISDTSGPFGGGGGLRRGLISNRDSIQNWGGDRLGFDASDEMAGIELGERFAPMDGLSNDLDLDGSRLVDFESLDRKLDLGSSLAAPSGPFVDSLRKRSELGIQNNELFSLQLPRGALESRNKRLNEHAWGWSEMGLLSAGKPMSQESYGYFGRRISGRGGNYLVSSPAECLRTLFPSLTRPPKEPAQQPDSTWPEPAQALAESLLRTSELASLTQGLEIVRQTEYFDVRWDSLLSRQRTIAVVAPNRWLVVSGGLGSQTLVELCDAEERTIFSRAFQLGRRRTATPADLRHPPLNLSGFVLTPVAQTYRNYTAEVKPVNQDQSLLILKNPSNPKYELRLLIDTNRRLLLQLETRQDGQATAVQEFSKFINVAGAWWATEITSLDAERHRTASTTQQFKELAPDRTEERIEQLRAGHQQIQFLREPLVTLLDATHAVRDKADNNKATFGDHLALLLHFTGIQQWDRVLNRLESMEQLSSGKPGLRWMRDAVLSDSRQREKVRERILRRAAEIAQPPTDSADRDELFLANYLLGQASKIFEANERMALLDVLKPIHERQPAHLFAMRQWHQQRVQCLQQTGQSDQAIEAQKQLATQYPHNSNLQQQYVQALINSREWSAASEWLDRILVEESQWHAHEEDSLRNVFTRMLQTQGRYPELVDYLKTWIERKPESTTTYQQYLSALTKTDQTDELNRTITTWMREGQQPDPRPKDITSKLQAAVGHALGRGYDLHSNRIDPRWLRPLAALVRFLARQDTELQVADQIMSSHPFRQSDQCRNVRREIAARLAAEIGSLSHDQIRRFISWTWPNDPEIESSTWNKIAAGLESRWNSESNKDVKHQIGQSLVQVLSGRCSADRYLAFLRRQLQDGPEKHHVSYAEQLFTALLAQPWSPQHEVEAFELLKHLSDSQDPTEKLATQIAAIYRLTDSMVQARLDALMAKIENQSELPRIDLQETRQANLRLARERYVEQLASQLREAPAEIQPWLRVERVTIQMLLGNNLEQVAEACWEHLGPEPRRHEPGASTTDTIPANQLEDVLFRRYWTMLANLALRKNAKPELVERLLAYVDRAILQSPEEPSGNNSPQHVPLSQGGLQDVRWQLLKYQLLVGLDRPEDLAAALQVWIDCDDAMVNQWRLVLGHLRAEQGQVREAIKIFEIVEAEDSLGSAEHQTLADWYLVTDQRQKYEAALVATFKMSAEHQLSNWLSQQFNRWQNSNQPVPTELDPNVLRVFSALFAKASNPQQHVHRLRQFYRATHDFRLLAVLPDIVVGQTAGKVYPLLQEMSSVLSEVRDEATADQILEHLATARKRASTDVDYRALDLLELLVERRAAELLDQPGPHTQRASAALTRTAKRTWSPGEPRLMSDLLASLGRIAPLQLAQQQVALLKQLHQQTTPGTLDRLHIAHNLARSLWDHGHRDAAVDQLEASLAEYQAVCDGILPLTANNALDTYITLLEQSGHHFRAETVLTEQLGNPANAQQVYWLRQRIYRLYDHALRHDGRVADGQGVAIYPTAIKRLQDHLQTDDDNHRQALIRQLLGIFRTAREQKVSTVADDLVVFGRDHVPQLLLRQTNNYQSIVGDVATTIHDLAGPRAALAFLIRRVANEPRWFRYSYQDGWNRHANLLGQWRMEIEKSGEQLGDLKEPLLALVTNELRRELESRQSRNRNMYWQHYSHFWAAQKPTFLRTAETVYAQQKRSGAAVQHIAKYLSAGLGHRDRAIEILLTADRDEILDEQGESQLVGLLHQSQRFDESIPLLEPMVERWPDGMQHRTQLMHVYFRTGRSDTLLTVLQETDEHFHEDNRWTENAISQLAHSCLVNHLFQQSVDYYNELISLHKRSQPNRGIGNGTLSSYCGNLARAYSGLGDTPKAVDAASEAIVSWGHRRENRQGALESLKQVLREAKDLDGYVAELDRQNADSGLDKPIVRKAIGLVYAERNDFTEAIAQLKLASELQPNDAQTYRKLIECYDQIPDQPGAVTQILKSLQLSRRDIQLYKELGDRLETAGRKDEAERAFTSIVDVLPNESEGHAMLADIRQDQDRWADAIEHWQQVAEIRALEPTGLLKLANAQIHAKRWETASATIAQLRARAWPSRFGNVESEIRSLEQQLENQRED